jgi:hypothetical protein
MDTTTTERVEIVVNGRPYPIHPGPNTGAQIKRAGEVPPTDELDLVQNGQLVPIADDQKTPIVGHEVFLSHPPSGGSS